MVQGRVFWLRFRGYGFGAKILRLRFCGYVVVAAVPELRFCGYFSIYLCTASKMLVPRFLLLVFRPARDMRRARGVCPGGVAMGPANVARGAARGSARGLAEPPGDPRSRQGTRRASMGLTEPPVDSWSCQGIRQGIRQGICRGICGAARGSAEPPGDSRSQHGTCGASTGLAEPARDLRSQHGSHGAAGRLEELPGDPAGVATGSAPPGDPWSMMERRESDRCRAGGHTLVILLPEVTLWPSFCMEFDRHIRSEMPSSTSSTRKTDCKHCRRGLCVEATCRPHFVTLAACKQHAALA
eukprot:364959-Chlamydomonas_euryale.AAC.1